MTASSSSGASSAFTSAFTYAGASSSSRDEVLESIEALGQAAEPSEQTRALDTAIKQINQLAYPAAKIASLIDIMLRTNRFDCKAPWQVLVRLEPLIKNKQALAQAAAQLYLPDAAPASFEQAQGALWFAAYTGNEDLAREAILRGAQVNTPLYLGMSALLLACKRGHDDLACLLLDQGADVKFIGGSHHHETPLSEALFRPEKMTRSLPRLLELDKGFSKEFHARKQLVHEHSVITKSMESSVEEIPFYLEGYRIRYIIHHYLAQSRPFYDALKDALRAAEGPLYDEVTACLRPAFKIAIQEAPDVRAKLCAAIDEMLACLKECLDSEIEGLHETPQLMIQKAIKKLDEGKPAVCFGITQINEIWKTGARNSHAWGLVIARDQTASSQQYIVKKCNRGAGTDYAGILTRTLSREEVHALITSYYQAANWKELFLNSGLEILLNIETEMTLSQFLHTKQKHHDLGICCYYSTQSIVLALLQVLFIPALGQNVYVGQALAKSVKGSCTSQIRPKALRDYLDSHFGPVSSSTSIHPAESHLLSEIFEKTKQKPKLMPCYAQFFPEAIDQLKVETLNVELEKIWNSRLKKKLGFDEVTGPIGHEAIRAWLNDPENTARIQQVTSLELDQLNLKMVPPEIAKFTGLTTLDLGNNLLRSLPAEIGSLSALRELYVSNNQLQSLPSEIGNLSALDELEVSNNQLQSLPSEIGNLRALGKLKVSKNQLASLPDSIGNLINLNWVDLDHNRLTSIPPQISHLRSLLGLNLKNNLLTFLPKEIGSMEALRYLYLGYNTLSSLPIEIGGLSYLKKLCLENNRLTFLPSQIANLTGLEDLILTNNQLASLPFEVVSMLNLKAVSLIGNPILFLSNEELNIRFSSKKLSVIFDTFKTHHCQTPLAALYQLIGTKQDPEAIQRAFAKLPRQTQEKIASMGQLDIQPDHQSTSSSSSSSGPASSSGSLFADMDHLGQTIRSFIYQTFEELPEAQINAVNLEIIGLAYRSGGKPEAKNILNFIETLETVMNQQPIISSEEPL